MILKKAFLFMLFLGLCSYTGAIELDQRNSSFDPEFLETKVPKDRIKAIHDPVFIPLKKAVEEKELYYLNEDSWLILVGYGTTRRLYPINLLIWHEVVNDTFNRKKLGITYCILTGSTVVLDEKTKGRQKTFGVSGMLYNTNLVMYDRQTGSLWPQLDPQGYSGKEKGTRVSLYPFGLVRFSYAQKNMSDIPVLVGSEKFRFFLEMYGRRPTETLNGYEDNDEIRSALNPEALKVTDYPIKSLFFYFPGENRAVPFSSALKNKRLFRIISEGDRIQQIRPKAGKTFITLYRFALEAFYPGAVIEK